MAEWNHRMCGECWLEKEFKWLPDGGIEFRAPVMIKDATPGPCCFCTNISRLGIYVRKDPKEMKCEHEEET